MFLVGQTNQYELFDLDLYIVAKVTKDLGEVYHLFSVSDIFHMILNVKKCLVPYWAKSMTPINVLLSGVPPHGPLKGRRVPLELSPILNFVAPLKLF